MITEKTLHKLAVLGGQQLGRIEGESSGRSGGEDLQEFAAVHRGHRGILARVVPGASPGGGRRTAATC